MRCDVASKRPSMMELPMAAAQQQQQVSRCRRQPQLLLRQADLVVYMELRPKLGALAGLAPL
jgi:hypothetical protein